MGHKLERFFNKKIKELAKIEKEAPVEKNEALVEKSKAPVEKNKAPVEKNKVTVEKNKDKSIKRKHDQAKPNRESNSMGVFYLFYYIHFDILYQTYKLPSKNFANTNAIKYVYK